MRSRSKNFDTMPYLTVLTVLLGACSERPVTEAHGTRVATSPVPGKSTNVANASIASQTTAGAGAFGTNSPLIVSKSIAPIDPSGAMLREGQCARQEVSTTRIVPTIWLVVDGSGSMVEALSQSDSTSRWTALRGALMDPQMGVVKSLEHHVKWGLVMYDGPLPSGFAERLPDGGVAMFSSGPAMTCPRVVIVEPALDNFNAIDMAYTKDPLGGSTPTDKALDAVVMHLSDESTQMAPDTQSGPVMVVLATDGAPNDFCSNDLFPADVRPKVIDAVNQLTAMNEKLYVISLAGEDMMLTQHLNEVAKAGATGKPPFIPRNKDELIQTFRDIIGPGAACDVMVAGSIKQGSECNGTVQINGSPLACDNDNGWRLKDAKTITITGTACDLYKADMQAVLFADFPCDAIMLN